MSLNYKMLTSDRMFTPLFWTQFFGAMNDNILKNSLIFMITFNEIQVWGMGGQTLVAFSGALFILPFFLFSAVSGQISDGIQKAVVMRLVKIWEVLLMIIAACGFYFHSYSLLMVVLMMMGLHSTFFGPVKYAIIPDLVPEEKLVAANAYIEMGTFVAILLGTIIGSSAAKHTSAEFLIMGVLLFVACAGLVASLYQKNVPISNPELKFEWNPLRPTFRIIKESTQNTALFNSILGISWFWFLGAAILTILPVYVRALLSGSESVALLFLITFTVGVGVGSLLCETLSFDRIEIGLVPLGSMGMSLMMFFLYWIRPSWVVSKTSVELLSWTQFLALPEGRQIFVCLLLFSVFAGIYIVPLFALVQQRSDKKVRSQMIASNNIINSLFMVVSMGFIMLLTSLGANSYHLFLIYALMNLAVAIYIYYLVPEFALRFMSWMLVRVMYRLRVSGEENIPKTGPVILACNHVSFIDWLIVAGVSKRPPRFVMDHTFLGLPLVGPLFRQAKVIPIATAKESPQLLERAFEQIDKTLREGDVLGIFPEGRITRDGNLSVFRPGIEKAVNKTPATVVPMALVGFWGSFFSFKDGRALMKRPKRFWSRVELRIGKPIPAHMVKAEFVQAQVEKLLKD
jgi:1-acyl-sn-glycerol-3-phosphate acyltransferase